MLKQFLHKGMRGFAISLLLAIAMVVGVVVSSEARLAGNSRYAVVLEAYYALNPGHYGFSSKLYNGWTVSDWNYIITDTNAYEKVRNSIYPKPNASYPTLWPVADRNLFYDNWATPLPANYANLNRYGFYGGYGRGGQCKFFADLILFRSGAAARRDDNTHVLPTYSDMSRSATSYKKARVGDIIFIPSNGHTAIVVAILARDSSGNVTEVDVIDSNFIGTDGNEMIARHRIGVNYAESVGSTSKLQNYYVYTGVSYYNDAFGYW